MIIQGRGIGDFLKLLISRDSNKVHEKKTSEFIHLTKKFHFHIQALIIHPQLFLLFISIRSLRTSQRLSTTTREYAHPK